MTIHNEAKKEEIAKNVIMPGDPNRVLYIADKYLKDYKIVNKLRGIYAITGFYKDKKVTVMASGMGIPSMGIYSYELYNFYDVDNIIRIGSCGSIKDLKIKDLLLVTKSYSKSTYAKQLNGYNNEYVEPSLELNDKIISKAESLNINLEKGFVNSQDDFYGKNAYSSEYLIKALEMESFALFYNALMFNKKAACLLTVSDDLVNNLKLEPKERENSFDEMITLALETIVDL